MTHPAPRPHTLEPARSCCWRCARPTSHCVCQALLPVATRTRIVILQHPRERGMKMGTARLLPLGLANATLHVGTTFDAHPGLQAARGAPGRAALLYPAPPGSSVPRVTTADTLVVVDGTWSLARKMIARSPVLSGLPRLAIVPQLPSAYRIRREPAAHCLSTLEAVVAALDVLEGAGPRCASLLAAFHRMIDRQVAHAAATARPYRHDRKRQRPRTASVLEARLRRTWPSLVVVQAEGSPRDGAALHELVQVVALRVATGEPFATLVRPRHPVRAATPTRLGLEGAALATAPGLDDALGAWEAFLRPDDVLVGWGGFSAAVLAEARAPSLPWIDVKPEVGRRLGRTGGVEHAAARLDDTRTVPWAPGRGGRRAAALASVVRAIVQPANAGGGTPAPAGGIATL